MPFRPALTALAAALVLAPPTSAHPVESDAFAPPDLPRPKRSAPSRFIVPLDGLLFSNFGYERGRLHAGIDIAVLGTDVVRAALPGVVTHAGYLRNYSGYGLVVRIRHDRRIETMYAHLASARVEAGERVDAGQRVARAGCTGSCTGTHLHFEVRVRGKLVDPVGFLPKNAFR